MFVIRLVGSIFSVVGLILFLLVFYFYRDSSDFIKNGIHTEAKIIGFESSTSSSSQFPVVEFIDVNNQKQRIKSNSTRSSYYLGENIMIYYKANRNFDIRIDDFFGLWGTVLLLSFMASIFLLLGLIGVFIGFKSYFSEIRARNYTKIIKAKIAGVVYNTAISANGRCPYFIEAKWLDESNNRLYIFKSSNIWFDPSDYLQDKEYLEVKVNETNYKKYWVDISFLPKLN
jgi:hypothetical protein